MTGRTYKSLCGTPGTGLVGAKTRSFVVPGPLYDEAASYDVTPKASVCAFETVSPDALKQAGSASNKQNTAASLLFTLIECL